MTIDKNKQNQEIYHPWKICEPPVSQLSMKDYAHYASLFSLGNGYIGIRASHEDARLASESKNEKMVQGSDLEPVGEVGTYINGFYESSDIKYGEIAYGYARESQTQLNVVNPLPLSLIIDDQVFCFYEACQKGEISDYQRTLSMSDGILERSFVWMYKPGKRLLITSRRMVLQTRTSMAAMRYQIYTLDAQVEFKLKSWLDGTVFNKKSGEDPRVGSGLHGRVLINSDAIADNNQDLLCLSQRTTRSHMKLGCAVAHQLCEKINKKLVRHYRAANTIQDADAPGIIYTGTVEKDHLLILDKMIAFTDERFSGEDEVIQNAVKLVKDARTIGFSALYNEQKKYMDNFWHHSQVKLKGDLALQQGLHFNTFHLLQSAGRGGKTSVSAKGLSGEGYEGHYFWDTEMYVLPFFLHTMPEISRDFLTYRYSILPQARQRAREMGHAKGALFAWRTINGNECSAYYPAGTAQYHINADIAYAVSRYIDSTYDETFLLDKGAEILFETAALWLDLGFYSSHHEGRFCIQGVTGPDEYNVLVDNNYYTNLMAQANMRAAAAASDKLKQTSKDTLNKLSKKLKMNIEEEADHWKQAASQMYFPYDEKYNICLQDDKFLSRIPWNYEGTDLNQYPLLLHFHPLVIYRHQVCKQADMVLAQFMHGNRFSQEEKERAFQYYEACTTHDSSLSASIYAVMACELGLSHKAYRYFMETARLDLENRHQNTVDGLHLANMAGTWMVMVNGYAGARIYDGKLSLKPQISEHWDSYQFRFVHQGNLLNVAVSATTVTYTLVEGDTISFHHFDKPLTLNHDKPKIRMPMQPIIKNKRPAVKAVIFDVDGVLLSTDEQHYLAWKKLADEEGIYFDRPINGRLRGISRMASLEILLEKSSKEYSDKDKSEMAKRKNNYYKEQISLLTPQSVLPGVISCLKVFQQMGLRLATGSSSKNAPVLLKKTELDKYFEAAADGNDISRSKPDPEVFLVAADKLGLKPEQCLVVEDAVSGIEAAKSGGFRSLAVGDASRQSLICDPDAQAHNIKFLVPEDILDI